MIYESTGRNINFKWILSMSPPIITSAPEGFKNSSQKWNKVRGDRCAPHSTATAMPNLQKNTINQLILFTYVFPATPHPFHPQLSHQNVDHNYPFVVSNCLKSIQI